MRFPWVTRQHRLFSFISMNWRAKPLVSYRVIVDLISTTEAGLTVRCELDPAVYPKGIVVSDDEMAASTSSAICSMESGITRSIRVTIKSER